MDAPASSHPTDEALKSYGLGTLEEGEAEAVSQHLERCQECRTRVAGVTADGFLLRVQDAQAAGPSMLGESMPGGFFSRKASVAPAPLPASTLPPGLADHPDYEILRELGRGGMGVVYLAENKLMGRKEVLKVVSGHLLDHPSVMDRFLREIRSAARLHHTNVVTAYSALRAGESIVFAMEYVEGYDLAHLVKGQGPLRVDHACNFVHQAALGLQYAHEKGMVHRDIKPSNLILTREGKKPLVKVLDFGLAKVTSEGQGGRESALTREGQMLGTPDYIAPEQIRDAQSADIRADVYSLGCTLYFLLAGRPPFRGDNLWDLYQAHFSMIAGPLNLLRPEIPVELAALVAKMMAKEPARRFQTPGEVAQAVAPFFKKASGIPQGTKTAVSKNDKPVVTAISTLAGSVPTVPTASRDLVRGPSVDPTPSPRKTIEGSPPPPTKWDSLIELREDDGHSAEPLAGVSPMRRPSWLWPALVAGVLLLGLLIGIAGVLLRIKTPAGTIVIENVPDSSLVEVDGDRVTITRVAGDPLKIEAHAGKHVVVVKRGDDVLIGETVIVEAGRPSQLTVHFDRQSPREVSADGGSEVERPVSTSLPPTADRSTKPDNPATRVEPPGSTNNSTTQDKVATRVEPPRSTKNEKVIWTPLFNGKDLAGWKVDRGDPRAWGVEDGHLVVHGSGDYRQQGYLLSPKAYADFILRFEFWLPKGSDSGVAIRAEPGETASPLELNLRDVPSDPPGLHAQTGAFRWSKNGRGSDYSPPLRSDLLRPSSVWNQMAIVVKGGSLHATLNGHVVQHVDFLALAKRPSALPALTRRAGRVGFQSHTGMVRFRNIELQELPFPRDLLQPGSVWVSEPGNGTFTIRERLGERFTARFELRGIIREVEGTIRESRLQWLARNVRAIVGGPGGDNEGEIMGDEIAMTYSVPGVPSRGRFKFKLKKPATGSPADAGHPADAIAFLGKHYKIIREQLSWHEAKSRCIEMGGHLAIVTNEDQNRFLTDLIRSRGIDAAWLGATDERREGQWFWLDGAPMRYRNWDPAGHQPNNKQGLEHYLLLWVAHEGKWSDQPDRSLEHRPGFVCQWD